MQLLSIEMSCEELQADHLKFPMSKNGFNLLEVLAKSVSPLGEIFTADSVLDGIVTVLAEKLGLGEVSLKHYSWNQYKSLFLPI